MKNALIVLLISLSLAGCTRHSVVHELRPAPGGHMYGGVYRINMVRGNPNGLDPVIINSKLADDIALQIYDRLIGFDSLLNVQPELASSWSVSENGTVYTFHLRSDVFFHDNPCFPHGRGRRMVARDVVYSLSRCCDPRTRSVAYWVFKDKVEGANEYFQSISHNNLSTPHSQVSGIQALNDTTVVIRLKRSYSPFLMQLSNALGCIVPHEAVDFYKQDYFRHPVGTGAFVFTSWKDDHEMILRRNAQYWKFDDAGNRLPYLDEIRVSFITDDKVQFQEFLSGNLDESFTIPTETFNVLFDPVTKRERARLPFTIQRKPAMLSWFIDVLCTKPPFDNADVRRACAYAIDKQKIVRFILRNAPYREAVHGITPPVMPGYSINDIQGFGFDPHRAQTYLSRAGFPNGEGFPEITLSVYPEPRLLQVAESVQHMLSEHLNIRVRLQVMQFAQMLDKAEAGELSMWGTRWYGDYPDVENYLSLWDGSLVPEDASQPSYPNSTRYNNPRVNELLRSAVQTVDVAQRLSLYKEAEKLATADAPAFMLFYEMHYRLIHNYVRNYPLDAMNRIQLRHVWFAW